MRRPSFTLQEDSWYFEKYNDLIANRTRDLPACSILPQPTMSPLAAIYKYIYISYISACLNISGF
jgi:hypothetical protein